MKTHAAQVELYELDSPINQDIAKQRERNAKMMEECTVPISQLV